MRNRLLAVFLLCVLTAAPAQAQFRVTDPAPAEIFSVELGLMFWTPTPEISIQTGRLAGAGVGEVDFVREFSLQNERFREFRAVLKPGRAHKLRIAYVPFEYEQDAILTRVIDFGDLRIPVSVPVTAHLKWDLWRFGYEWDFVAADRGLVGLVTELKHNKLVAELSAPGLGSEEAEVTAPILTLGLIGRGYLHRNFSVTAEFTGFKLFGFVRRITDAITEDLEAKMYDFDLYGTVNFGRHVGVQGGYRSVTAEYLVDLDTGDLKMKGLYLGGLVRF